MSHFPVTCLALLIASGCAGSVVPHAAEKNTGHTQFGPSQTLGAGAVRTFVEFDANDRPVSYGLEIDRSALDGLPAEPNHTSRCYDLDGNGSLEVPPECEGDEERFLELPTQAVGHDDIPIRWVGLNWNPMGHEPMPWKEPHFDMHFYLQAFEEVQAIRPGPCGILINCDDFEIATRPLEAGYVPAGYISVDAAVTRMGNHLINPSSPELDADNPSLFTHTFIYGTWDAEISFIEPMITRAFLLSGVDDCFDIPQPAAFQRAGYYPTRYCIAATDLGAPVAVTLSGLEYRSELQ